MAWGGVGVLTIIFFLSRAPTNRPKFNLCTAERLALTLHAEGPFVDTAWQPPCGM